METNSNQDGWTYDDMGKVMLEAAKETCGVQRRRIENPWTIGHERELEDLGERIKEAARERNRKREAITEAHERRENRRQIARREREWEEAREGLKQARRQLKRRLRTLEKEWWRGVITECEEACSQGRIGEMYKLLQKLGTRGRPAGQGHTITKEEFKGHFERVS